MVVKHGLLHQGKKLRVFENRIPPRGMRMESERASQCGTSVLCTLQPKIVRVIKSRSLRWVGRACSQN